jgi:hypothetical protein
MANKLYEENSIAAIANGIRQMNGLRTKMTVSEMANSITAIPRRPVVPEYWKTELDNVVQKVRTLKKNGGDDEYQFVLASDLHYRASYGDNNYGKNVGNLASYIMNACHINYFAILGDLVTNAVEDTKVAMESNVDYIFEKLAPVGRDRLILMEGNHDIAYGDLYHTHFTKEEVDAIFYEPLRFNKNYHFSEDGSYYYVDDGDFRFIVLNSFWTADHSTQPDGTSTYDHFNRGGYGQDQIEWLANTALNFDEEGKYVVICSHIPMTGEMKGDYSLDNEILCRDNTIVQGVISAYMNKTSYTGSRAYSSSLGEGSWGNVNISVDYTNVKNHAKIMAVLGGHVHKDGIVKDKLPCLVGTITCVTNHSYDENAEERKADSITETAFDVVSINKKTGTINFVRVGVGNDRVENMSAVYHKVHYKLTNCTSDTSISSVKDGGYIMVTLSPITEATMDSITVTMNGVDVTSSYVKGNTVTIDNVSGDIIITGKATKPVTNWIRRSVNPDGATYGECSPYIGDNDEDGYRVGYRINSSGVEKQDETKLLNLTGYIPVSKGDTVYLKNVQTTEIVGKNPPYIGLFDKSFNKLVCGKFNAVSSAISIIDTDTDGNITQFKVNNVGSVPTAYMRICSYTINDDAFIAINEPIK